MTRLTMWRMSTRVRLNVTDQETHPRPPAVHSCLGVEGSKEGPHSATDTASLRRPGFRVTVVWCRLVDVTSGGIAILAVGFVGHDHLCTCELRFSEIGRWK